jgi:hypothetical protein
MDQDHIDSLLERYLALLDEYTRLRDRLTRLQSGVYQGIARANFSAERGLRYGQDQYDGRMRALRVLDIRVDQGGSVPSFVVVDAATTAQIVDDGDVDSGSEEEVGRKDGNGEQEKEKDEVATKPVDPLRWFGLLAPMSLRNAQGLSVEAVEQVIPRLVTVNAEMLNLEIEVRRARKKRSKAAQQQQQQKKTKAEAAIPDPVSGGEQVTPTSQVEAS